MMSSNSPHTPRRKRAPRWIILLAGIPIAILLLALGYVLKNHNSSQPRTAPEAEQVLSAQTEMPFQVLIPAYLPAKFARERVKIHADRVGPQGEPMIQLVYPSRQGGALAINEWIPSGEEAETAAQGVQCTCVCTTGKTCTTLELGVNVGPLRVLISLSAADIVTMEEFHFVLDTLGPAVNQQIYDRLAEVPVTFEVPEAVEIPIDASGVQDFTLVATPDGYSPAHFSVKKGVPVRLTFRQLGQVGCGNELILQLGGGKSATLTLVSQADKKVLEFTPSEAGDFRFNCPHLIYRGVMTVTE